MNTSRFEVGSTRDGQSETVDLPALQTKPSFETLLKSLKNSELPPTMWTRPSVQHSAKESKAVSQYFLSVVSSDLRWLEKAGDDEEAVSAQKDELWQLASKRLAERCGRSARPEMTRTWEVLSSAKLPDLGFEIREPPLTGDKLGLKTWGTAFAIVKKLEDFKYRYFSHLLDSENNKSKVADTPSTKSRVKVLELGSGTGLVGIAASAIWATDLLLTDLPDIKENLLFNIDRNRKIVEFMGGSIQGDTLDWRDQTSLAQYSSTGFEIIIATDPLYDDDHPNLVVQNIKRYIKPHEFSRALVAIPMRDNHTKSMAQDFKELMQKNGLKLIHDGEEVCHDDWADIEGEDDVKCWWSIWKQGFAP